MLQKFWSHLKTLGTRTVTRGKVHIKDSNILGATIQNLWAGGVVGIATGYGLHGPGIESRWGGRFSAPVQTDPGAHPAFCTMRTGTFPGVKNGRGVKLTPHPLLVPWSRKSRAIPLLPYGPYGCLYKGAFYHFF